MQETKEIWGENWNWQFPNIVDAWDRLVEAVASAGEVVKPRGHPTREINNVSITYPGVGRQYTFYNPVRNLNPIYHLVELFYYLNGRNDGLRGNYIKNAEDYVNLETGRHDGSYGPAFYYGLPLVLRQLRADPDTRRAVLPVLRLEHLQDPSSRDVPCNDLFAWRIREGALDMNVVTRSQDLYIGWLYNMLGFQLLHLMLTKALSLEVGTYGHYIFSLHLYEKDVKNAVESIGKTEVDTHKPELPDWSIIKFWDTVNIMDSAMQYPGLHGHEYHPFQDDLVTAVKIYKEPHKNLEPTGMYGRWVKRWIEEKKK